MLTLWRFLLFTLQELLPMDLSDWRRQSPWTRIHCASAYAWCTRCPWKRVVVSSVPTSLPHVRSPRSCQVSVTAFGYGDNDERRVLLSELPCRESCVTHAIKEWINGLGRSLQIYLPVHFLPAVIFRFQQLRGAPASTTARISYAALRSSAFLTSYQVRVFCDEN